jgi:hypothetical protein
LSHELLNEGNADIYFDTNYEPGDMQQPSLLRANADIQINAHGEEPIYSFSKDPPVDHYRRHYHYLPEYHFSGGAVLVLLDASHCRLKFCGAESRQQPEYDTVSVYL